ncbi:MAG: DUF488 family protein [Candidatus Aminicenantes bacterium]
MEIWEIGHSSRSQEEFLRLVKKHKIEQVIDVRRFPSSKKFPHFHKSHLQQTMAENHMDYIWMGEKLGGFRKGGYEEWMKTEDFAAGVEELEKKASHRRTAVMCAEGYFRRCHRRFILEYLEKKGWEVQHIH